MLYQLLQKNKPIGLFSRVDFCIILQIHTILSHFLLIYIRLYDTIKEKYVIDRDFDCHFDYIMKIMFSSPLQGGFFI